MSEPELTDDQQGCIKMLEDAISMVKNSPLVKGVMCVSHNPEQIGEDEYREGNRRIVVTIIENWNPRSLPFTFDA